MPHRGAGASFKLGVAGGSPGGTMTEVSIWCNEITGDAATDELDATTFDPDATQPTKTILFGATDRTNTLNGLWNEDVEDFFTALDGAEDVPYEYGPLGDDAGKPMISGLCNVGAWSGPAQTATGLITFTVTVKPSTRTVGVAA